MGVKKRMLDVKRRRNIQREITTHYTHGTIHPIDRSAKGWLTPFFSTLALFFGTFTVRLGGLLLRCYRG